MCLGERCDKYQAPFERNNIHIPSELTHETVICI